MGNQVEAPRKLIRWAPWVAAFFVLACTVTAFAGGSVRGGSETVPPMTAYIVGGCPTISVGPALLPSPTLHVAYSQFITASGGATPYSFAVTSGALPTGLSLNGSTGEIAGTPSMMGSYSFGITVTDNNGCTGSTSYTVSVVAMSLSPTTLPDGIVGTPYDQTISVVGGTRPPVYFYPASGLPPGLSLADHGDATASLAGTPNQVGSFNFTITAEDSNGRPATQAYTINIVCPAIDVLPETLPPAVKDQPYSQTLTATGGVGPYSFSLIAGALPSGLTLSPAGLISGAPTVSGSFSITVNATDANQCTGTRSYTFAAYTGSFHDDGNTSALCVDNTTGSFLWSVAGGQTFTGTLSVYNGGTMFWSQPGASQYVYLYYDPNNHAAWGYLYDYSTYVYSSLFDSNTLDDPPGCSPVPAS